MKICPVCGTEYPLEEEFCSKDGQKLFRRQAATTDPLIGKVLEGRYRVNRLLGEGGMGRVYLATNINAEMEVALKILNRAATQDRDVVKRFETERRIISRLRHPNILKLLDSFHVETGELVIVVEYVAGMTLEEEIHKGRLTEIRTLYILKEVFDALTEAHKAGIIHRDLKPSNIMLEEIGDRTLVKILDFGIAKHLGSTGLTAGGTLGTPAYMSPEQVEGASLDGRSDIYSMGIVAYECLAGRPPFEGENAFSIIRKHIMEKPPSLSGSVPPIPVSRRVEAFISHLLEKAPQDRPIDARAARELVEGLYRFALDQKEHTTRPLPFDVELPDDDDTIEGVKAETLLPQAAFLLAQAMANQESEPIVDSDNVSHARESSEDAETLEGVPAASLLPNAPALFEESVVSAGPKPIVPTEAAEKVGMPEDAGLPASSPIVGGGMLASNSTAGAPGRDERQHHSASLSQPLIEPVSPQALSDPETAPFSIVDIVDQQVPGSSNTDSIGVLSTDGITRIPDESSASLSTGDLNWHEDTTALQDSIAMTESQADTDVALGLAASSSNRLVGLLILAACLLLAGGSWFLMRSSQPSINGPTSAQSMVGQGVNSAKASHSKLKASSGENSAATPSSSVSRVSSAGPKSGSSTAKRDVQGPTLPQPTIGQTTNRREQANGKGQVEVKKKDLAPVIRSKSIERATPALREAKTDSIKRRIRKKTSKKKAKQKRARTRSTKKPKPKKKVQAKYDDDLFD